MMVCVTLLFAGCGPKQQTAVAKQHPYCFVEEHPDRNLADNLDTIKPINEETVLLFPVITKGVVNGKRVYYGLGSPVLYKQGDDVENIQFKGVERWPTKRYLVWARGYYPHMIPRQFLLLHTINGTECAFCELIVVKPGTDQQKMVSAMVNELKKGSIIVEDRTEITDGIDYARLIRASELRSWRKSTSFQVGWQTTKGVWNLPGAKVDILLTSEDFQLIESYLRGEVPASNSLAK